MLQSFLRRDSGVVCCLRAIVAGRCGAFVMFCLFRRFARLILLLVSLVHYVFLNIFLYYFSIYLELKDQCPVVQNLTKLLANVTLKFLS